MLGQGDTEATVLCIVLARSTYEYKQAYVSSDGEATSR